MADIPRSDYGVQPNVPWPRTDGPDSLVSGDTTHTWGDGSVTTWRSVLGGNISSSEQDTVKALRSCTTDHNNAPTVCYGCKNTIIKTKFPSEPDTKNKDCNKCYRNPEAVEEVPALEDLYITQYCENRLAHKFATETIPAIKAQLRIEIAKELSERKEEDSRIMNHNLILKTIKKNKEDV